MERRSSYFEVIGQFLEIAGATVAIISTSFNFPLNLICAILGIIIGLTGLLFDFLSVKKVKKIKTELTSKQQIQNDFSSEVIEYAYSKKLFPLFDSFNGKTLKLIHQDIKNKKVYEVIPQVEFPDTNRKDNTYKACFEKAKEQIDGFLKNHSDLEL